jgi:hypothetical protein
MIRLYDPDPGTEPILPSISSLRILQWHADGENGCGAGFERKIDDPEAGRPVEEEDSETAGIVIRRVSRVRERIASFFERGFRILAEPGLAEESDAGWRFLSELCFDTDHSPPVSAGVHLLHPFAFHPLFLSLFSLIGEGTAGEIERCRMRGTVPDLSGLAALLDIALLLNIGDPDPAWIDVGVAHERPELRGTIHGSVGRIEFDLSESSSLELVTAERRTRVPLPEGDGVRYALLDFSTQASKNLESTIYPLRLGISLRKHSAGLLPRFSEG